MARRKFTGEVQTNVIDLQSGSAVSMSSMQLLGSRLLAYRKRANMTQQQLAEALGVTNNAISMWEKGKSRPDL